MKVRKRVTLMVVTVSAIFGICWPTDLFFHVVDNFSGLNPVVFSVTHTLIMFNSAVNPFAYALINQRFREKIKGMICRDSPRVNVVGEPQSVEMTNNTSQATETEMHQVSRSNALETSASLEFVEVTIC